MHPHMDDLFMGPREKLKGKDQQFSDFQLLMWLSALSFPMVCPYLQHRWIVNRDAEKHPLASDPKEEELLLHDRWLRLLSFMGPLSAPAQLVLVSVNPLP